MRYFSTRGGMTPVDFKTSVLMGLARDGGLLLPDTMPDLHRQFEHWKTMPYSDLAFQIMSVFSGMLWKDLRGLVDRSYATFTHPEITPVVPVGDLHVLELFHGPTLAFKDVALQFLGNLFEATLKETGKELNILAATSGDTGSAAIHGIRGRERMRIFVMHPKGRVSEVQERQMTTVPDANVFNIAVDGTFDDCQRLMKTLFSDLEFKDRYSLGTVNSINWSRILAQIVYYFYAAFRVMEKTGAAQVQFAVPTGNFGDIFAGYFAAKMGLPVSRLVLATNENDILARFFNTGIYSLGEVHATVSPSMDIQVASNFERYLYYRVGSKPETLRGLMERFAKDGKIQIPMFGDQGVDPIIAAGSGTTESTLATIREFHAKHGYLLDPHTAVGVDVARRFHSAEAPMICLATAHPAKFGTAILDATGQDLAHHPLIDGLKDLPTRCDVLPADASAIRSYMESRIP